VLFKTRVKVNFHHNFWFFPLNDKSEKLKGWYEIFQKGLLGVEAVFSLVKDDALETLDYLFRHLFAWMGWQAVEEDGGWEGLGH
jgi:hypothetical protein